MRVWFFTASPRGPRGYLTSPPPARFASNSGETGQNSHLRQIKILTCKNNCFQKKKSYTFNQVPRSKPASIPASAGLYVSYLGAVGSGLIGAAMSRSKSNLGFRLGFDFARLRAAPMRPIPPRLGTPLPPPTAPRYDTYKPAEARMDADCDRRSWLAEYIFMLC